MAFHEFVTPHFVATERFAKDLGTADDRRTFERACAEFHQIRHAANELRYPARHQHARALLAALPIPQPSAVQAEKVFDLLEEAARRELHDQLVEVSVLRFEDAVKPAVGRLLLKLAEVLDAEAAQIEGAEVALAKAWGVPHYESPLLLSVAGTARELRDRVARGFSVYNGDLPEAILGGWFERPLAKWKPASPAPTVLAAA